MNGKFIDAWSIDTALKPAVDVEMVWQDQDEAPPVANDAGIAGYDLRRRRAPLKTADLVALGCILGRLIEGGPSRPEGARRLRVVWDSAKLG